MILNFKFVAMSGLYLLQIRSKNNNQKLFQDSVILGQKMVDSIKGKRKKEYTVLYVLYLER
jgi:acyl-homoserine lactone acylase PvdQ